MRKMVIGMLLSWAAQGLAQGNSYVIRQLLLERNRAVIGFSGDLAVGTDLIASLPGGKQCVLKVKAVGNKIANLDTSSCGAAKELAVGQKLEPSLALDEPEAEVKPPPRPVEPAVTEPNWEEQPLEKPKKKARRKPSGRQLTDIQFLPSRGRTAGRIQYESLTATDNLKLKNGGQYVGKSNIKGTTLDLLASYGISNELAVVLTIENNLGLKTDTEYGPASTSNGQRIDYESSGWGDPLLEFHYRILDQKFSPFNLDVTFGYSPKGDDAVDSSDTKKGNSKRGGDVVALGGEFGQKFKIWSYSVSLATAFFGSAESKDADTGTRSASDAYHRAVLMAVGQAKLSEVVFMRGKLTQSSTSDRKFTSQGSSDITSEAFYQAAIGLELIALVVPETLAVSAGIEKTLETDITGQSGTTDLIETVEGTQLTLGLGFLF